MNAAIRIVATFAGAVLIGACSVPIEPSPRDGGLTLRDRFSGDTNASTTTTPADPRGFWHAIGAAGLDAAVERALVSNRDLLAAAARLDAARARAELAGAELAPTLTARLDAQRRRFAFVGLPIGNSKVFSATTNQHALSFDLSWEADLWGRVRAGDLAAEADVAAADADLAAAAVSIAARTCKAWFAAVEAAQQLELAERTAESRRVTVQMIERRFENGVRPAFDVLLARADLDAALAAVQVRRRALDGARRALSVLCGSDPTPPVDSGAALPATPPPVPPGLPVDLLRRRPDLLAAERRLAAADARHAQAKADRWPRLTLTASGGTTSDDLRDLVDLDFRVWSLGADLLAPLFDGGRRTATIELRDAERREAEARFAALLLQALADVENGLQATATLAEEERSLDAAARQSHDAATIAADRYGRGLSDVTTLLDAQRRALLAETALLAVRRARLDAHVELILALGGGFASTPAQTGVPPQSPR
ncbi:MAG: TolC family protein [Planctomycetota bacterium]